MQFVFSIVEQATREPLDPRRIAAPTSLLKPAGLASPPPAVLHLDS